jgi:hypothetical protein
MRSCVLDHDHSQSELGILVVYSISHKLSRSDLITVVYITH